MAVSTKPRQEKGLKMEGKRGLKRGLLLTLVCRILFLMISLVHFDDSPRILSHNVFDI